MASPEYAAVSAWITGLKDSLLVELDDFSAYTAADKDKALAFRLLASAAIEEYIETTCKKVASAGLDRFLKSQPTRTGKCLVLWLLVKNSKDVIPLADGEFIRSANVVGRVLRAYNDKVDNTHGMMTADLRGLVLPLGVVEADLDQALLDQLDTLGALRNAAAHVRQRHSIAEPIAEWVRVEPILKGLEALDNALHAAITAA